MGVDAARWDVRLLIAMSTFPFVLRTNDSLGELTKVSFHLGSIAGVQ